jgi:ankyrin repeat protein
MNEIMRVILFQIAKTILLVVITLGSSGFSSTIGDYGPHLHWEGAIRGPVTISIQAWTVKVCGSNPDAVGAYSYYMSLPLSDADDQEVAIKANSGGVFRINQQPRKANGHTAIIQIDVSKPTHIFFDLLYSLQSTGWFDAPRDWWYPRDIVHWSGHGKDRIVLSCSQKRCEATQDGSKTEPIEQPDLLNSIPVSSSTITLDNVSVPGSIHVMEMPSKSNNYIAAVSVVLRDKADYSFDITWMPLSDETMSPLHLAAQHGYTEAAALLLANKADVNIRNRPGMTPLHFAVERGNRDVVKLLLANKADINARDNEGKTPLHTAVRQRRKDMVILLLANKADINARNNRGWTPLHIAVNTGRNEDIAALLLIKKADVSAQDNGGLTPLHLAVENEYQDLVAWFLANRADVNTKGAIGATPLHTAVRLGRKDIVELLLANKAEVNAKNDYGSTPLRIASQKGFKDIVELLHRHGGHE